MPPFTWPMRNWPWGYVGMLLGSCAETVTVCAQTLPLPCRPPPGPIGVRQGVAEDWSPGVDCPGSEAVAPATPVAAGAPAPDAPRHAASIMTNANATAAAATGNACDGCRLLSSLSTPLASFMPGF